MRMGLRKIIYILCLFFLVNCGRTNQANSNPETITPNIQVTEQLATTPTWTPYIFKTSEAGSISIHSFLLVPDPMFALPDPSTNDAIFLVPLPSGEENVSALPKFNVGEVPQAETNETTGEFMFTNIFPGKYLVMVITSGGSQIPARFNESGNLAVISVEESDIGQTKQLEYLVIP